MFEVFSGDIENKNCVTKFDANIVNIGISPFVCLPVVLRLSSIFSRLDLLRCVLEEKLFVALAFSSSCARFFFARIHLTRTNEKVHARVSFG